MAAGKLNLKIEQGATFYRELIWKDALEVPIDLTGFIARLHMRDKYDSVTTLLELTTENGGIVITPLLGKIELHITAAATTAITWLSGVYDLELESSGGTVTRLIKGSVSVDREVTR